MLKSYKIQDFSVELSSLSQDKKKISNLALDSFPNYTDVNLREKIKRRPWRLPIGEFIRRLNNRKKVFVTSRFTFSNKTN